MIPPKHFDIFFPDWEMLRKSRRVQTFLKHLTTKFCPCDVDIDISFFFKTILGLTIYPPVCLGDAQKMFGGTLVVGLITEPLGFVQDARDVMVLFHEWLGVLGSVVFVCWTIPLQDNTPVCHDCLVVNRTSTFIMNIPSRHGC